LQTFLIVYRSSFKRGSVVFLCKDSFFKCKNEKLMNLRIPHSYDTDGVIPDKIIISAYLGDKKNNGVKLSVVCLIPRTFLVQIVHDIEKLSESFRLFFSRRDVLIYFVEQKYAIISPFVHQFY